ncbi:MAG: high frequency lysogenization protein [Pseudohongiellaceae bacterium]|jgi:high frequency lysogenization protein
MNKTQEQVIALAGLFQAMDAIEGIAQQGRCDEQILETALSSLFVGNPANTLDVFSNLAHLKQGLIKVRDLLNKSNKDKRLNAVRYALAIIHLESKLNKQKDMLSTIGKRLERAENQVKHFNLLHENVLESIAAIYLDTISTFQLRVQISGDERLLKMGPNVAKIRSLLLSGIRAATLWRQVGGRRWHFIFKRAELTKQAEFLLSKV